jgi:Ca2+-binding EF-hand superfamily protein
MSEQPKLATKAAHATKTSSKNARKKQARLVNSVSKNLGVSRDQVKEILVVWKKHNKSSINSLDEFQAALEEVGFWKKLGVVDFEEVSKHSPNYKKEVATELFHVFDKDHDGQITTREFITGVLEYDGDDPKKEAELLFEAWDEDNSGTLSKAEVKKLWVTRRAAEFIYTTFSIRKMFHSMAISRNSGYLAIFPNLTKEQLETFAQQKADKGANAYIGEIKAAEKAKIDTIVDKIFEQADTDKNGTLSKKEFVNFFSDNENLKQIRAMSRDDDKTDQLLDSTLINLSFEFLETSSDEVAKKCGKLLRTVSLKGEDPTPEEIGQIPSEILERVVEVFGNPAEETD